MCNMEVTYGTRQIKRVGEFCWHSDVCESMRCNFNFKCDSMEVAAGFETCSAGGYPPYFNPGVLQACASSAGLEPCFLCLRHVRETSRRTHTAVDCVQAESAPVVCRMRCMVRSKEVQCCGK